MTIDSPGLSRIIRSHKGINAVHRFDYVGAGLSVLSLWSLRWSSAEFSEFHAELCTVSAVKLRQIQREMDTGTRRDRELSHLVLAATGTACTNRMGQFAGRYDLYGWQRWCQGCYWHEGILSTPWFTHSIDDNRNAKVLKDSSVSIPVNAPRPT
jgi:hypothetical protein